MTEQQQSTLIEEPRVVDVVAIERELTRLWKQAGESTEGQSSPPVVRACSLNLVVVTRDMSQLETVSDMVGQVTAQHPSRIFLITLDDGKQRGNLEAWISARCSLPVPGGIQVCCEEINLIARGSEGRKIPNVVLSLLVPDVPTILLWKAPPAEDDGIFRSLLRVSDRLVIDSSENASPELALKFCADLAGDHHERATCGDLAWTHLTLWRTLVAQAFQPVEARRHLANIESLDIEYSFTENPPHSGLSQSLLFVGWLGSRLHWNVLKRLHHGWNSEHEFTLEYGSTEPPSQKMLIHVRIAQVHPPITGPGGIESIALHGGSGLRQEFRMIDDHRGIRYTKKVDGHVREEMVTPVRNQEEPELVSRELEVLQRDATYEGSLVALVALFPV